jgi:hypothetical protein
MSKETKIPSEVSGDAPRKTRKPDPQRSTSWRPTGRDARDTVMERIERLVAANQSLANNVADLVAAMPVPPPSGAPKPPVPPPRVPVVMPDGRVQVPTQLSLAELRAGEPSPETARRMRLAAEQANERYFREREEEYLRRHGRLGQKQRYDISMARLTYIPENYDEKTGRVKRKSPIR